MCFDYDYVPYIRRNIPGYNLYTFSDVLASLLFDAASAATNCQVWYYLKPHQGMTIESTEPPPFQLAKHHILPLAPHVNSNTQKLDTCIHVRVRVGVLLDLCTTSRALAGRLTHQSHHGIGAIGGSKKVVAVIPSETAVRIQSLKVVQARK